MQQDNPYQQSGLPLPEQTFQAQQETVENNQYEIQPEQSGQQEEEEEQGEEEYQQNAQEQVRDDQEQEEVQGDEEEHQEEEEQRNQETDAIDEMGQNEVDDMASSNSPPRYDPDLIDDQSEQNARMVQAQIIKIPKQMLPHAVSENLVGEPELSTPSDENLEHAQMLFMEERIQAQQQSQSQISHVYAQQELIEQWRDEEVRVKSHHIHVEDYIKNQDYSYVGIHDHDPEVIEQPQVIPASTVQEQKVPEQIQDRTKYQVVKPQQSVIAQPRISKSEVSKKTVSDVQRVHSSQTEPNKSLPKREVDVRAAVAKKVPINKNSEENKPVLQLNPQESSNKSKDGSFKKIKVQKKQQKTNQIGQKKVQSGKDNPVNNSNLMNLRAQKEAETKRQAQLHRRQQEEAEKKKRLENEQRIELQQQRQRKEKEQQQIQRKQREKMQRQIAEKEKIQRERIQKQRAERQRIEKQKIQKERLQRQKILRQRQMKEQSQRERIERQRLQQERTEKERLQKLRFQHQKRRQRQERQAQQRQSRMRESSIKQQDAPAPSDIKASKKKKKNKKAKTYKKQDQITSKKQNQAYLVGNPPKQAENHLLNEQDNRSEPRSLYNARHTQINSQADPSQPARNIVNEILNAQSSVVAEEKAVPLTSLMVVREAEKQRVRTTYKMFLKYIYEYDRTVNTYKRIVGNVCTELQTKKHNKRPLKAILEDYFEDFGKLCKQFNDRCYKIETEVQTMIPTKNSLASLKLQLKKGFDEMVYLRKSVANNANRLNVLINNTILPQLKKAFEAYYSQIEQEERKQLQRRDQHARREKTLVKVVGQAQKNFNRSLQGKFKDDLFVEITKFINEEKLHRVSLRNFGRGILQLRPTYIRCEKQLFDKLQEIMNKFKAESQAIYSFARRQWIQLRDYSQNIRSVSRLSELCTLVDLDYIKYVLQLQSKQEKERFSNHDFENYLDLVFFDRVVGNIRDTLKGATNKVFPMQPEGEELIHTISGNMVLFQRETDLWKDQYIIKNLNAKIIGAGFVEFDQLQKGILFDDSRTIRLKLADEDRAQELICYLNEKEEDIVLH